MADGDIDIGNATARVVGGMPGLPDLSGEMLVTDIYTYTRKYGETKYTVGAASSLVLNPATSVFPIFQSVMTLANDPTLSPVLVGTENENGVSVYHIRIEVSTAAMQTGLKSVGQALGGGMLDLYITTDTFQVERLDFSTSDPNAGTAAARFVFSNWNGVSPILTPDRVNVNEGTPLPEAS